MSGEIFEMEAYCPVCQKDTNQKFESAGHERDSSGDKQSCLECGSRRSGLTGDWFDKRLDKWLDLD